MLTLENFLSDSERTEFAALVAEAEQQGAQAVRWHSAESRVLVIALFGDGKLQTWFASPAQNATEAAVVQAVVLLGVDQARHTLASLQTGAHGLAAAAINKARH